MDESLNTRKHQIDDNELIFKAQAGDRKALSRLVNSYEKTVYNFVRDQE